MSTSIKADLVQYVCGKALSCCQYGFKQMVEIQDLPGYVVGVMPKPSGPWAEFQK